MLSNQSIYYISLNFPQSSKRKPGIVTTWEMKRQKRKIGGDVMARIYHAMDYFPVL